MKRTAFFILCGIAAVLSSCEPTVKERVKKIDSVVALPIPADTSHRKTTNGKNPDTANKAPESPARIGFINEATVYYTIPYCGGARPTEEISAKTKELHRLANTTLKLRNSTGEFLVVTDDKGVFHSGIKSGTYDVYLTEKTNKKIYDVSATGCENCLTQKMATVTLAHGSIPSIVINFRCGPDAKWRP
jgi:hypothetical protein